MILIGLHGKAHAGKDTVGQMLVGYGLDRVAFADPIKRMLIEGLGLTAEHFDSPLKEEPIPWLGKSPRQLMQTLGTEWGRDLVNRLEDGQGNVHVLHPKAKRVRLVRPQAW
jgi:hypothetical protein